VIEASADPAAESWRNINAIDDLIFEIRNTMSHLVIAGLRGNAGAGAAMLPFAADYVYARSGVVLNPHYRSMGGLYGSEYWTYTLPQRVGRRRALELTLSCWPIGTRAARDMGFLDDAFSEDTGAFEAELREQARRLARNLEFRVMLRKKHEGRLDDESVKPLASYRAKELERMQVNFFGPDPTRPVGASSSRGNRRRRGPERRFDQRSRLPPEFSRGERAGPALVLRAFRDRFHAGRLIRAVRERRDRLQEMAAAISRARPKLAHRRTVPK
jgi:enoyl-CoA hydratase/carnithine racemase